MAACLHLLPLHDLAALTLVLYFGTSLPLGSSCSRSTAALLLYILACSSATANASSAAPDVTGLKEMATDPKRTARSFDLGWKYGF